MKTDILLNDLKEYALNQIDVGLPVLQQLIECGTDNNYHILALLACCRYVFGVDSFEYRIALECYKEHEQQRSLSMKVADVRNVLYDELDKSHKYADLKQFM